MAEIEQHRFTVAVFQDVLWAKRGLDALARHGFPPEALTVMAKETVETAALIQETFGTDGGKLDLHVIGPVVAHGPLVDTLQGSKADLGRTGVAGAIRRVGFQAHDGFIFETLTARGGVLVAIRTEPRAADALAVLHAYGGGNAAIGAWTGRV